MLSFIIGTALGVEREYRSKAAGLRTMIVICLGSTIFTEISHEHRRQFKPDRIASTSSRALAFGTGVILKDGLTISGITTTATTIWISAALGMAVGAGEYMIAVVSSIRVLIVLTVLKSKAPDRELPSGPNLSHHITASGMFPAGTNRQSSTLGLRLSVRTWFEKMKLTR